MNDVRIMRRLNAGGDLADDVGDDFFWQRCVLLRETLENFSRRPFDGQEMQTIFRLTDFNGAHHVGMLDAGPVFRFAQKPGDRRFVLTELFS